MYVPTDQDTSVVLSQIAASSIVVSAIEWLKRSNHLTWINAETEKMNRFFALIGAFISAIGIHMAWNHGALPGQYMLEFDGVTLAGVGHAVWAVVKSFYTQKIIFQATVKPAPLTGQVTVPVKSVVAVVEQKQGE